jgi:hypothetical protein
MKKKINKEEYNQLLKEHQNAVKTEKSNYNLSLLQYAGLLALRVLTGATAVGGLASIASLGLKWAESLTKFEFASAFVAMVATGLGSWYANHKLYGPTLEKSRWVKRHKKELELAKQNYKNLENKYEVVSGDKVDVDFLKLDKSKLDKKQAKVKATTKAKITNAESSEELSR